MVSIGNDWDEVLKGEFDKPYYLQLRSFLAAEYRAGAVYPDMHDIFNALKLTPYNDARVVLLGQDPYHGEGQAHGLCFSVKQGVPPPPSLKNMFKEIQSDLGAPSKVRGGELTCWAEQGVLLLNTVLTVRGGQANSHKGRGWEMFTDRVITLMNEREQPVVFLLWGANARAKAGMITNKNHLVLCCAHPSPLSAHNGFFGCKHFTKTNEFLAQRGKSPIRW